MKQTDKKYSWITRQAFLLSLSCLLFLIFIMQSAHASPILRQSNVISDSQITLSDIFSNLGKHIDDRVLGPAPRPGQDMVLNARTLLRIALATDIDWRPSSSADYIVLSSAATLIDREMITDKLKAELRDQGIKGTFDLMLSSDSHSEMILPQNSEKNVVVQDLSINRDRDWFKAVLVAPSIENPLQRIQVAGRIESMVNVPVLNTSLRKGSIISSADIDMINVPARNVTHDTILNKNNVIGMTPSRIIINGQPILEQDLRPPVMVERGKSVTMLFEHNGLQLTAMGRALQNGSKGDMIRVVNETSSRTVEAEITGQQEVTVRTF